MSDFKFNINDPKYNEERFFETPEGEIKWMCFLKPSPNGDEARFVINTLSPEQVIDVSKQADDPDYFFYLLDESCLDERVIELSSPDLESIAKEFDGEYFHSEPGAYDYGFSEEARDAVIAKAMSLRKGVKKLYDVWFTLAGEAVMCVSAESEDEAIDYVMDEVNREEILRRLGDALDAEGLECRAEFLEYDTSEDSSEEEEENGEETGKKAVKVGYEFGLFDDEQLAHVKLEKTSLSVEVEGDTYLLWKAATFEEATLVDVLMDNAKTYSIYKYLIRGDGKLHEFSELPADQ